MLQSPNSFPEKPETFLKKLAGFFRSSRNFGRAGISLPTKIPPQAKSGFCWFFVFQHHQQLVAGMQFHLSVRNEKFIAALDQHDEGSLGDIHVGKAVSASQHVRSQGQILQTGVDFFRKFNTEFIAFLFLRQVQMQQSGYLGDGHSLYDQ